MSILIFFDINGTLIKRDSRTDLPFSEAVDRTLSLSDAMNGVNTAARSDMDVFMEVLSKFEIEYTNDLWETLMHHYKDALERYKSTDVWRENADAIACLDYLKNQPVYLSLITGELSIGAQYKLEKLGIWHHFPTGGFGEDGLTRFEIADKALEKAIAHYNRDFQKIYVIGDTLLDIKTARHLNAKIISITTGANTREELSTQSPDYLIDTFMNDNIWSSILAEDWGQA